MLHTQTKKNPRLSNLQLELLKMYSRDISEKDLIEIKRILSRYFADKAAFEADKIWKKNGYSNNMMDQILHNENQ